jgi:hypothetical protein
MFMELWEGEYMQDTLTRGSVEWRKLHFHHVTPWCDVHFCTWSFKLRSMDLKHSLP